MSVCTRRRFQHVSYVPRYTPPPTRYMLLLFPFYAPRALNRAPGLRSHSRQVRELRFEPRSASHPSLGSLHTLMAEELLTLTSQGWHTLSRAAEHYKMAPGRSGSR